MKKYNKPGLCDKCGINHITEADEEYQEKFKSNSKVFVVCEECLGLMPGIPYEEKKNIRKVEIN
jgi:hypothetical protein